MAAPSYVFTLAWVAKMRELAEGMEPEDGCLSGLGSDDDNSIIALTPFGVENLQQILEDHKERR